MTETATLPLTEIELIQDDITLLEADAIVFYAQPDLELGSGFGTALSIRGGPAIKKELENVGPLETGQVALTSGGNLKAKFVVHAVGPKFQEEDLERKLKDTVLNSIKSAEEAGARSIAFPPMGTGFYGIPLDVSARIMIDTINAFLADSSCIEEVKICLLDSREFGVFRTALETSS